MVDTVGPSVTARLRDDAMKEKVLQRAKGVIADALREQWGGVALDLHEVRPEEDGAGDEFLWITVVYDGEPRLLGRETTRGLRRRLRLRFEEENVEAFPVIAFTARADLEEERPAAR